MTQLPWPKAGRGCKAGTGGRGAPKRSLPPCFNCFMSILLPKKPAAVKSLPLIVQSSKPAFIKFTREKSASTKAQFSKTQSLKSAPWAAAFSKSTFLKVLALKALLLRTACFKDVSSKTHWAGRDSSKSAPLRSARLNTMQLKSRPPNRAPGRLISFGRLCRNSWAKVLPSAPHKLASPCKEKRCLRNPIFNTR